VVAVRTVVLPSRLEKERPLHTQGIICNDAKISTALTLELSDLKDGKGQSWLTSGGAICRSMEVLDFVWVVSPPGLMI